MASKSELAALLRECRKVVNDNATWPKHNLLVHRIDAALAPEAGETVRVRIAVAVGRDGQWAAHGWMLTDQRYDDEAEVKAVDHYRRYAEGTPTLCWVEADLEKPLSKTVEGECV